MTDNELTRLANEIGDKLCARIMLLSTKLIIEPDKHEWIGLNLLHRDNELPSSPPEKMFVSQSKLGNK